MRDRAKEIGAKFIVESTPENGTMIQVEWKRS
jgi:signal transduction histidine kinase